VGPMYSWATSLAYHHAMSGTLENLMYPGGT
jgi:hypothetical protein